MSEQDKLMQTLGLAQKAGKLASGDTAVRLAAKAGKAELLLLAGDASENSCKAITDLAAYRQLKIVKCLDKQRLGLALGKAPRTAVAVLDKGFCEMIKKIFPI